MNLFTKIWLEFLCATGFNKRYDYHVPVDDGSVRLVKQGKYHFLNDELVYVGDNNLELECAVAKIVRRSSGKEMVDSLDNAGVLYYYRRGTTIGTNLLVTDTDIYHDGVYICPSNASSDTLERALRDHLNKVNNWSTVVKPPKLCQVTIVTTGSRKDIVVQYRGRTHKYPVYGDDVYCGSARICHITECQSVLRAFIDYFYYNSDGTSAFVGEEEAMNKTPIQLISKNGNKAVFKYRNKNLTLDLLGVELYYGDMYLCDLAEYENYLPAILDSIFYDDDEEQEKAYVKLSLEEELNKIFASQKEHSHWKALSGKDIPVVSYHQVYGSTITIYNGLTLYTLIVNDNGLFLGDIRICSLDEKEDLPLLLMSIVADYKSGKEMSPHFDEINERFIYDSVSHRTLTAEGWVRLEEILADKHNANLGGLEALINGDRMYSRRHPTGDLPIGMDFKEVKVPNWVNVEKEVQMGTSDMLERMKEVASPEIEIKGVRLKSSRQRPELGYDASKNDIPPPPTPPEEPKCRGVKEDYTAPQKRIINEDVNFFGKEKSSLRGATRTSHAIDDAAWFKQEEPVVRERHEEPTVSHSRDDDSRSYDSGSTSESYTND